MRILLSALLFVLAVPAFSQDITGIWRGHFISSNRSLLTLNEEDRYKFEVQLDQNDKAFNGVTYSYKTTVFYGKAACYGTISKKTKKVLLEETELLELKTSGGTACIMTCFLQYSKMGREEVLEGTYTSMNATDSTNCGKGTVFLRKVTASDFHKEPFLLNKAKKKTPEAKPKDSSVARTTPPVAQIPKPKPKVVPAPAKPKPQIKKAEKPAPKTIPPRVEPKKENFKVVTDDSIKNIPLRPNPGVILPRQLSSRTNELIKTISTSAREISINIYDNGTIDNDTVSVYLDNKLVISKQRLTEKAISLKVLLNEKDNYHELVMVAENLGEIPPNTSLMVVKAGEEQYEVRITSTEQKNGVIAFKFQP